MIEFITLPEEICRPGMNEKERVKLSTLAHLIRRNFKGIQNDSMSNSSVNFSEYDHDATLEFLRELPKSQAFNDIAPPPEQAKTLLKWVEANLDVSLRLANMKQGRQVTRADLARQVHTALQGL